MKLKRIHDKDTHNWTGNGHYHNSTKSIYKYKNYIIKNNGVGWNLYNLKNEQLNPITYKENSFKEVKQILKDFLKCIDWAWNDLLEKNDEDFYNYNHDICDEIIESMAQDYYDEFYSENRYLKEL